MTPAIINLTIYQGSDWRQKFKWQAGEPAAPVDLTGATAAMQIRRDPSSPTPEITLTTENGGIAIEQVSPWAIELIIPAALSSPMAWSDGVYDLEITQGTDVTRVVMGAVTLSKEVTK